MEKQPTLVQEVINYFFVAKGWDNKEKSFYIKNRILYGRYTKPAKELLILADNDLTRIKKSIKIINIWATQHKLDWGLETVIKRWQDIKNLVVEKYSESQEYYEEQNKKFNEKQYTKEPIPDDIYQSIKQILNRDNE